MDCWACRQTRPTNTKTRKVIKVAGLVPTDLPIDQLESNERKLVLRLLNQLNDSWLVIPRFDIRGKRRTYELDVLLINQNYGLIGIEVKGGKVEVISGAWHQNAEILSVSPPRQAQNAAYELRNILRLRSPKLLKYVHVDYAVALPGVNELNNVLPPDVERGRLILNSDMQDLDDVVYALMTNDHKNRPLSEDQINEILFFLRPDSNFKWNVSSKLRLNNERMQRLAFESLQPLLTLDQNTNIFVTGSAGTGKSFLATLWAERAFERGERTLLTCYNEPMGHFLAGDVTDSADLVAGPFQKTLFELADIRDFQIPEDADQNWWDTAPFAAFMESADNVLNKFDTIIVDEAQDFSPKWLPILKTLFKENGPKKLFMLADPSQDLYHRGLTVPAVSNVVRFDLTINCRNTKKIAELTKEFSDAKTHARSPEGNEIKLIRASANQHVVESLESELDRLIISNSIEPSEIMILTGHRELRDYIKEKVPGGFECSTWEESASGQIVCETIQRCKGLERTVVVLATTDNRIADTLLYVGLSRANSELIVMGPPGLLKRIENFRKT